MVVVGPTAQRFFLSLWNLKDAWKACNSLAGWQKPLSKYSARNSAGRIIKTAGEEWVSDKVGCDPNAAALAEDRGRTAVLRNRSLGL